MDNSYIREKLLKKFPANKEGTWRIRGEDPNCDMGGSHIMPDLGTVQGQYSHIVDYALSLSGFIAWGSGGDIELVKVKTINSLTTKHMAELKAEKEKLKARLAEIDDELK